MKLLITKDGKNIQLDDKYVMKENEFGVWFWEDFFNKDCIGVVENPNYDDYIKIYQDFKGRIKWNQPTQT